MDQSAEVLLAKKGKPYLAPALFGNDVAASGIVPARSRRSAQKAANVVSGGTRRRTRTAQNF